MPDYTIVPKFVTYLTEMRDTYAALYMASNTRHIHRHSTARDSCRYNRDCLEMVLREYVGKHVDSIPKQEPVNTRG